MNLDRINVKFFLEEWEVTSDEIFKIFNQWISNTPDEVLIDIADYGHVHDGPEVLLVGNEANYCIDNSGGKRGLLYSRKRGLEGTLSERFHSVISTALQACRRLQDESGLEQRVRFAGNRVLLIANDRLLVSPDDATRDEVSGAIKPNLQTLFGGEEFEIKAVPSEGERTAFMIRSDADFDLQALLQNMGVN